jgi:4-amino-4-deoxy-L-arabinose transferase-like glycosyltransferase
MLAVSLAAVLFVYPLLIAAQIPLLDPDEGLHAAISQEMVERGDWLVPKMMGKPFLDKPILYFWAQAASLRLWGMSEAAVRLPGLMLGLLGAATTAALAWRMFGRAAGIVAGLFYATTILPLALAQAAAHDVALVPCVNLAWLGFWETDAAGDWRHLPRSGLQGAMHKWCLSPFGYTVAVGLILGLAILTKGLAGVALVGIAYGAYLLITRRLTVAKCAGGCLALAIAVVVAAGWYLAVEHRQPGYLHYYFVERHLMGFATGSQRHGRAEWWYYLPLVLFGGLPWIAYLPVLVRDTWEKRRLRMETGTVCREAALGVLGTNGACPPLSDAAADASRPLVLLACWLMGGTLFLSLSHAKLVTYIWPVFPAVAILAAVAWSRLFEARLTPGAQRLLSRTLMGGALLAPLVVPAILAIAATRLGAHVSAAAWVAAALVSLSSLTPMWTWTRGHLRATLAAAVLVVAAQFAVVMTTVVPQVASQSSARDLAAHINGLGRLPPRLWVVNERIGSLVFYLDPKLRSRLAADQFMPLKLDEPDSLASVARSDVLAVPERYLLKARRWLKLDAVPGAQAGRYRLYRAGDVLRGSEARNPKQAGSTSEE